MQQFFLAGLLMVGKEGIQEGSSESGKATGGWEWWRHEDMEGGEWRWDGQGEFSSAHQPYTLSSKLETLLPQSQLLYIGLILNTHHITSLLFPGLGLLWSGCWGDGSGREEVSAAYVLLPTTTTTNIPDIITQPTNTDQYVIKCFVYIPYSRIHSLSEDAGSNVCFFFI